MDRNNRRRYERTLTPLVLLAGGDADDMSMKFSRPIDMRRLRMSSCCCHIAVQEGENVKSLHVKLIICVVEVSVVETGETRRPESWIN